MPLTGHVAVVTGGGAGIGHAIVTLLASRGASVAFTDLVPERCAAVADAHVQAGRNVLAITGDAGKEVDVEALFTLAEQQLGVPDIIICNAFSCASEGVMSVSLEDWEADLRGTLTSAFLTCRRALPGMVQRGNGSIVTIGSINSTGHYGGDAYSAAKAGLISLTRSMAVRYGPRGIRANAVIPGSVRTDIQLRREQLEPGFLTRLARWYPLGRIGEAEDIANAVGFLASAEAAWITGSTLTVDGGLTAGNQVMTDELVVESGDELR